MVFPIAAVIGGVLGIGSSILGSQSQASQARAQNAAAEKQAKNQYDRAIKEWNIQNAQATAQWQWDKARIAQLRFNDRQAEADYGVYTSQMIKAATKNLEINEGALYDKYVTQEQLRGLQTGIEYNYAMGKLGSDSSEALRQYLTNINQTALRSDQLVSKVEQDSQQLLGSFALDEARDQMGWQINQLTAIAKGAEDKGLAVVRQGGGATAQRLAMDAGMALGRAYGELNIKAQDRSLRLDLFNNTMRTSDAAELGQYALAMQDTSERMKYTSARYQADYTQGRIQLKELTIPTFDQASNQYQRELDALKLQTQGIFDTAARPYRGTTYFDPLQPIFGLKPEMISPTAVAAPSALATIGNAIFSGAQGVMSASYQKPGGGLGFY
jgi:hypothetical protein